MHDNYENIFYNNLIQFFSQIYIFHNLNKYLINQQYLNNYFNLKYFYVCIIF